MVEASLPWILLVGGLLVSVLLLFGRIRHLKRKVAELVSREEESQQILEQMAEAVLVLDKDMNILMMNQTAKAWLLDQADTTPPETLELLGSTGLISTFESAIQSDRPVQDEFKIYRSGEERILSIIGQYVPDKDRVVFVIHELTKLVRLESMRQEFVANVSHELKTPVTSILGFVETLLTDEEVDLETRKRFLGIVHNQAQRLGDIIDELLTLSRLEQEGDQTRMELADPRKIIADAVEACSQRAEKRGCWIELALNSGGPILMNPPLLEQALINLLDNAIKYGDAGSRIELGMKQETEELLIWVSDRGTGIPQRELEAIFHRFYRIDKARSRSQGGTGLGLSIVKHIAKVHQGSVEVKSRLGLGSTFTIHLPTGTSTAEV